MADHIVTLTARQETALQAIIDRQNSVLNGTVVPNPITADEWIRRIVLAPIKAKIDEMRAADTAAVSEAYYTATNAIKDQVKVLLGVS